MEERTFFVGCQSAYQQSRCTPELEEVFDVGVGNDMQATLLTIYYIL